MSTRARTGPRRTPKPSTADHTAPGAGGSPDEQDVAVRISEAAAQAGVSARTLRYYEELGLLAPSDYTAGGERRYSRDDLARLDRILELRSVLGMNLDDIKRFLDADARLEHVREAYRAKKGVGTKAAREEQRALLVEALELNEALTGQLDAKLARMDAFRSTLLANAERCRELLADLG